MQHLMDNSRSMGCISGFNNTESKNERFLALFGFDET